MHNIETRNNRPRSYRGYVSRPIVRVTARVSGQQPAIKPISDVKPITSKPVVPKSHKPARTVASSPSSMMHQKAVVAKTSIQIMPVARPRNHISGIPTLPEPSKFKFFRKRKPIHILRKK